MLSVGEDSDSDRDVWVLLSLLFGSRGWWWPCIIGELIGEMDIDSDDGGDAGMNAGAAHGEDGVMGEVGMTAGAAHTSELGPGEADVRIGVGGSYSWCK